MAGPSYNAPVTSVDLTDFARDAQAHVARIKAAKVPESITVDGREEIVMLDAEGYHALLDQIERADLVTSLRQSMADGEAGLGVSAAEARRHLREKHGF